MIKVAYNNVTGVITGYYPDGFEYKNIPVPNISIPNAFYENIKDELTSGKYIVSGGEMIEKYHTDESKLIKARKDKLSDIKSAYIRMCRKIDDVFSCYSKRSEFNLLDSDDEADYQTAKTLYISATTLKRELKTTIENSVDVNEITNISIPIDWLVY